MTGGWERRTPHVTLDTPTLARLLAPAFPGAALVEVERLPGGLANTNYRVRLADGGPPVVVRLYTRDPDACAREVALLRLVAGAVPAPRVLCADPDASRYRYPSVVLSWVEGTPLLDALPTLAPAEAPALAAALGATAARIGAFTFAEPGFLGPDLAIREPLTIGPEGLRAYIHEMLFAGRAGSRLGHPLRDRLWAVLDGQADTLAPLAGQRSLVHADYKDGNLLVAREPDGAWRVTGALDWEFAFVGASVFDLGSLLRREASLPPGFASALVAAYRAAGGFAPPSWRRMTLLMDLLNLCDFANLDEERPARLADITALIHGSVERLERDAEREDVVVM